MSTRLTRHHSQARTREALIASASAAFRTHGFFRASAESIAADAGFTRGALYANFDGKEGLFLAVLDGEIDRRRAAVDASTDPSVMAARYIELLDGDPGWTLAILEFSIYAARDPELTEQLRQRNDRIRLAIRALIAHLRPDLEPDRVTQAARLILAVNTGVSLERALDPAAAGEPELSLAYSAIRDLIT